LFDRSIFEDLVITKPEICFEIIKQGYPNTEFYAEFESDERVAKMLKV
jgi:hypothetical protein